MNKNKNIKYRYVYEVQLNKPKPNNKILGTYNTMFEAQLKSFALVVLYGECIIKKVKRYFNV